MLSSEKSIEQITKRCIDILYKYPQLFVISTIIHKESCNYTKSDREDYVKYYLQDSIGLGYIIRNKTQNVSEIWWTIPFETFPTIVNGVIESVLLEYTNKCPIKNDLDNWKKMVKKEKLNL